jgi:flagellar P-ring protein precursor FlgI
MNHFQRIKKRVAIVLFAIILLGRSYPADAMRIKDITDVGGVRGNMLVGYGLVIGLAGTGDKTGTRFTTQSLSNMLSRMGLTADPEKIKVKNVAAVMVTAELPPFATPGIRIDVTLSSLGDAKTLQGGTLLMTPLKGPNQIVYAVAQGAISVGGFVAGPEEDRIQVNHTTVGRISGGAIVERGVPSEFDRKEAITFSLHHPDFTTAARVVDAINLGLRDITNKIGEEGRPLLAYAPDSTTISVTVPEVYKGRVVEFMARIERLSVEVDFPAKIVVNERAGTIVMGAEVKILDVAIAHGNLTIEVKKEKQVSQPPPLSAGTTQEVAQTETVVTDEPIPLLVLKGGPTIDTLVKGLNALGVSPRDLISILQAVKAAGALQAELEII